MIRRYDVIPPSKSSIIEYLRSRGLVVDSFSLASLTRVPTAAHPRSKNGAFLIWQNCGAAGEFSLGWVQAHDSGDGPFWFVTKPQEEWVSTDREWVAERQKEMSKLVQDMRRKALGELTAFYAGLKEAGDKHPYLEAKRVRPHPALRIYRRRAGDDAGFFPWLDNCLIIPYFNACGELMTLQRIPWEERKWNEKLLYPGAVKRGAFLCIEPDHTNGKFIGIAEGFATADSFSRTMDMPVYAAIDGGNMAHVAAEVARLASARIVSGKIIIVADNDCETQNNPGINYALKAAEAANSNSIFIPVLGNLAVDANDLYVRYGEDLLRSQAAFLKTQGEVRAALGGKAAVSSVAPNFALSSLAGESGLYYRVHKKSGIDEVKIGGLLEVVAKYREEETGEGGKVVRYAPDIALKGEKTITAYIPDIALASSKSVETLKLLPSYATVKEYHPKIVEYINNAEPAKKVVLMRRIGWEKGRDNFQFPGDSFEKDGVEYTFPREEVYSFMSRRGTFKEWKEKVAALASGNSRAVLALSEAFASPVRSYLGDDDDICGWHIIGPNSCGKSTCAKIGVSTYGRGCTPGPEGEGALVPWYKTENQMELAAVAHNHMCLYLDEMKMAAKKDPRALEIISYMLTMGNGKGRMTASGKDAKIKIWRIGFFSTGEESLVAFIERGGGKVNSGQEVRVCDIPGDPGYEGNIFEDIHGRSSSAVFAEELKENTKNYYGHAFPAFIASLVERGISEEEKALYLGVSGRTFFGISSDSPQEFQRVSSTMCYNRLAIHLGIKWGILPWNEADESAALAQCFYAWQRSFMDECGLGGVERSEEQKIRDQWTTFIQENRGRFTGPDTENIGPYANYGVYDSSERIFYIWPGTFQRYCGDKKQKLYHLRVLREIGMLPIIQASRSNVFTTVKKVQGTCCAMYGIKLLEEPEDYPQKVPWPDSFPEPDKHMEDCPF